jgi:hypothetical protein
MKKIKLMLLGLLAMVGSNAFAQKLVGDVFPVDNFVYEVTKLGVANGKAGEVKIVGVRKGYNPVVNKALVLVPTIESMVFDDKYSFYVTAFDGDALRTIVDNTGVYVGTFTGQVDATSVEFPKYIKEIPATALDGYTNMKTVTFAAGSELTTVNNGAFATTQIEEFDFGNCKKLAGLGDQVFVQTGKKNSFITEVTLPGTTLFKSIGEAFRNLTSLTKINGLENSSVQEIVSNAFNGDTKLTELTLPSTIQTIEDYAFMNTGIETLTIDVTSIAELGQGKELYGTALAHKVLKSLTLKGNLGGVIGKNAFRGLVNLETLDLSELNFASKGQIDEQAFAGCTKIKSVTLGDIMDKPTAGYTIAADAFKGCTALESFTIGNINSAGAIAADAFNGCTELASVTIGDITANDVIAAGAFNADCAKLATVTIGNINGTGVIGAAAFGEKLKTVTIGTVKAGGEAILAGAFVYGDFSGATLKLATGTDEFVSSDNASDEVIATGAFDFSAVVNGTSLLGFVWPEVTIGEIRSQGGAFDDGALKGNNIAKITFGNIAKTGLDARIIDAGCTVATLIFNGTIGIGGIVDGAFANLASVMSIVFNGELAEGAIAAGAFEGLKEDSKVEYNKAELSDVTINPFAKQAFSKSDGSDGVDEATVRIIDFVVANEDLKAAYEDDAFEGLTTDGNFEIYLVKFYVAPTPPVDYNKFMVYQEGKTTTAWARYWVNKWTDANPKTPIINDKKIARYQTLENGAKVKLTLYGTYTDDPGASYGDPTVFMVPLKAIDGFYEIDKTIDEAVIVKAEIINGKTFADKDIELSYTDAITEDSWWGNGGAATLTNDWLFINPTIITNQQLIDNTVAIPTLSSSGIYSGSDIVYDLYVMNDPSKYKGFRIDKNVISKEKKTYVGEGWWCMFLRKTTTAAARIVWMDDAEATAIYGVKEIKTVENGAIYTLQGVRVKSVNKGQIYIQNGKKFIAK